MGLATLSKAADGYCKFTNGLIIQWGRTTAIGIVTLPTAFTTTNYSVTYCQNNTAEHNVNNTVRDKTTTTFKFGLGYAADWIAIGY